MVSPKGPVAALQTVLDRERSAPPIARARYAALYTRMLGELTGDLDLMTAGLHPAFELHSEDTDRTVLSRAEFTTRMTAYAQSPAVMWMAWEQLDAGTDSIAGYGRLIKVSPEVAGTEADDPAAAVMSVKRCAVFLEFKNEGQLLRERVFPGLTLTRPVSPDDVGIYGSAWVQGRRAAAAAAAAADCSLRDTDRFATPTAPRRRRPTQLAEQG